MSAPARCWYLLVAAGTAPFVAGCGGGASGAPATAAPGAGGAPTTVEVVTPAVGAVSRTLTQPATVQAIEEVTLYAKTAGYLRAIHVDRGDRVRAGQVVAEIESPELYFARDQAGSEARQLQAAALGAAAAEGRAVADEQEAAAEAERVRAAVAVADAVVERARTDLQRRQADLVRLQSVVEEEDLLARAAGEDEAQAEAELRRTQYGADARRAAVASAQASLRRAEANALFQRQTFERLKAVQDRDAGLIPAQDVDRAQAAVQAAESEVAAARSQVRQAEAEEAGAGQEVQVARRQLSAAAVRREARRSHVRVSRDAVRVGEREAEGGGRQVTVTETQRESSRRSVAVAEAHRRSLRAELRAAEARAAAARLRAAGSRSAHAAASALAGYTRIVAPFDGVVIERLADTGALLQNAAGSQSAARGVVRLARDASLRIVIPVPEASVARVRRGQAALIAADAFPGQEFRGTVTRFAGAVDPRSRTMLTEVEIPNPGYRLRPGMYARVTLTLETHAQALSIPSEAVMGPEEKRFVYTVAEGRAHRTPVTVGVDDGKLSEIKEGLQPGDQVVVLGRDTLVDGAAVTVKK